MSSEGSSANFFSIEKVLGSNSIPDREPDGKGQTSGAYHLDNGLVRVFTFDHWKLMYWHFYLNITRGMWQEGKYLVKPDLVMPLYTVDVQRLDPLDDQGWKNVTERIPQSGLRWDFTMYENTWVTPLKRFLDHWGKRNFIPDIKRSNFMYTPDGQTILAVDPFVHGDMWDLMLGEEGHEWRVLNDKDSTVVVAPRHTT
jgi:hypothetical protein